MQMNQGHDCCTQHTCVKPSFLRCLRKKAYCSRLKYDRAKGNFAFSFSTLSGEPKGSMSPLFPWADLVPVPASPTAMQCLIVCLILYFSKGCLSSGLGQQQSCVAVGQQCVPRALLYRERLMMEEILYYEGGEALGQGAHSIPSNVQSQAGWGGPLATRSSGRYTSAWN